jgi:hypothetical protein
VRLGVDAAVVHGELVRGDVAVDAGRVVAVGLSSRQRGRIAVPGSVDIQVNGYGGVDLHRLGVPLEQVIDAVTRIPAAFLGRRDRGCRHSGKGVGSAGALACRARRR